MSSWISTLLVIVLLSVYGRALQYWISDTVGYRITAWLIGLTMLTLAASLLAILRKKRLVIPYFHMLWFLAVFLVLPLLLDRVEERIHFLSFGLYGAISMLLFKPYIAIGVCLLLSGGDEILQFYLPDRVGDWRDVAMNMLASMTSAIFIWISLVRPRYSESINRI